MKARRKIISDFNIVSGIFEKAFNISIELIRIQLFEDCDQPLQYTLKWNGNCKDLPSLDKRLSWFSEWRSTQPKDSAIYHLVSGCSNSGEVVGIAWLNQVCQMNAIRNKLNGDIVSGTSITVLIPNHFATIAHEIGHNFGAVHDCASDLCSSPSICSGSAKGCPCCPCSDKCDCMGKYLMTPQSGGIFLNSFSQCTIDDICSKISILAAPCLKGKNLFKFLSRPGNFPYLGGYLRKWHKRRRRTV